MRAPNENKLTLIVLAGGLATRLRPVSLTSPKCLLEINGKSIIELVLRWARIQGVDQIVLALGHFASQVEAHTRNLGLDPNLIAYSYDSEPNFGTARAVKKAATNLSPDSQIAVVFSDSCLSLCLEETTNFQLKRPGSVVMTALPADLASEPANMLVDEDRLVKYPVPPTSTPPPTHTDYGLTVMTAHQAQQFSEYDLKLELAAQVDCGNVYAHEVKVPYIEIGTLSSYESSRNLKHFPKGMEWMK